MKENRSKQQEATKARMEMKRQKKRGGWKKEGSNVGHFDFRALAAYEIKGNNKINKWTNTDNEEKMMLELKLQKQSCCFSSRSKQERSLKSSKIPRKQQYVTCRYRFLKWRFFFCFFHKLASILSDVCATEAPKFTLYKV